jgi:hypothetical protein
VVLPQPLSVGVGQRSRLGGKSMPDNFYLSGLDNRRWFGENFENYHLFGYVGDRDRLRDTLQSKSFLRRLFEIVAPRVNIGTILNALAQYNFVKVDPNQDASARDYQSRD